MPVTRRSVLRDAALLTLAGAASHSPLNALDQTCPNPTLGSGPSFASGIRVFFSGAWIFCSDSAGGILAVTTDMDVDSHHFPYGKWKQNDGIDDNPWLSPKERVGNYLVTIDGKVLSAPQDIDSLFGAAIAYPFVYLKNLKEDAITVDISGPKVRVISLPIPTRILPAAFMTNATISGDGKRLQQWPDYPHSLATTHIFDYGGASGLTLSSQGEPIDNASKDSDYHFHTIPTVQNPGSAHPVKMFGTLRSLLKPSAGTFADADLKLDISGPEPCLIAGSRTPADVSLEELEIERLDSTHAALPSQQRSRIQQPEPLGARFNFNYHVGSCAGGAIALGVPK